MPRSLFKRLGFEEEVVLRDHAMGANGVTHDLLMLSFHTRLHQEQRCNSCGVLVLSALALDGARLCSHCYELRYQELGGGGERIRSQISTRSARGNFHAPIDPVCARPRLRGMFRRCPPTLAEDGNRHPDALRAAARAR